MARHSESGMPLARLLMVLGSLSPLFVLWAIRGNHDIPDVWWEPACAALVILPNAALIIRWRVATSQGDQRTLTVRASKDQSEHFLIYLFAMLIPLFGVDVGSSREALSVLAATVLIVFIFWHMNLHYINLVFAVLGYTVFTVDVATSSSDKSKTRTAVVLSKRYRIYRRRIVMRNEFDFGHITSVEFCVNVVEGDASEDFQIPIDPSVQDALRDMLRDTANRLDGDDQDAAWDDYELSEKYASSEHLRADLNSDEMAVARELFDEEGWHTDANMLSEPKAIAYYFAVYRDPQNRKIVGVRRAAQFKGVVSARLLRLFDNSLQMLDDQVFKLDLDFDYLITSAHVYILHPAGFEATVGIQALVSERASENAEALGESIKFANFERIAEFVKTKRRAARLVAALSARDDLDRIKRSKFIATAAETGVVLEKKGSKIGPAPGSELGFLELLDRRRYTVEIMVGAKEAFLASSRKRIT